MQIFNLEDQIHDYDVHQLKVRMRANGYTDSEDVTISHACGPTITIDSNDVLRVIKILPAATALKVYLDNTLLDTVSYNGSSSWSLDLNNYTINDGGYNVTVEAVGTGLRVGNRSNAVKHFFGITPLYAVTGLYNSTPALTRTDDAVGLGFTIDTATGAIQSDFNSVFPWDEATVVTDDFGNKFLRMPDMYFKVDTDSNGYITGVGVTKQPRNVGTWYKCDSFDYGIYGASVSGGKLRSVSGVSRQGSATRAQFRSYAAANGAGYFQKDLYHSTVMRFLWLIEWATKDSASIMTGTVSGSLRQTGGTDALTTPSGYIKSTNQMRYHYIEDFVGNMLEFIDGIWLNYNGSASAPRYHYVTDDPTKFADVSTNMQALNYPTPVLNNACIAALGWDHNNPFMVMSTYNVSNGNYNTYFCDQSYLGSGSPVLYSGAYYNNSNSSCGLFFEGCASAGYTGGTIGGRLLRKS